MEITQLWVILMLVVFQGWWCDGCLEEERIALLQFKASVDHLYPDSLTDWVEGNNCCNWIGVDCNTISGRVVELAIDEIRDPKDWYLNTSLFLPLKELRALDLSENGIAGCVENEGFERLLVLNHLEDLYLTGNNLDGKILSSLNALSSLKRLYLRWNKIEGSIDIQELNNLTSLTELDLGFNSIQGFKCFQGKEEKGVLKLKNLEFLDLGYNLFDTNVLSQLSGLLSLKTLNLEGLSKGSINSSDFETLLVLNHLEDLDLSYNHLDGSILSYLRILSSLKRLNLVRNKIKGSIDIEELNALSNLEDLQLNGNGIDQFVSSTGGQGVLQLNKLQRLHLNDNHFNNSILLSLKHLSSLKFLELVNNRLEGAIHMEALDNLSDLVDLKLDGNKITEVVASKGSSLKNIYLRNNTLDETKFDQGICQFKHLEELYLNYNNLNGELPSCLANLTSLQYLDISSNHLRGNIPSFMGICQLKHLVQLQMSYNNLDGELPSCLANLTSLQHLDISFNHLRGNIPSFMGEMQLLGTIDLSNNHLQGGIPNTLSNCSSLHYLDLSNNNFFGRLPEWMGNMINLQTLALSQNHFFGTLPHRFNPPLLELLDLSENNIGGSLTKAFYNCSKLRTLDVTHNNFTGEIPKRIKLLSNLRFLLLSYNNLEGEIPIELCKLDYLRVIDLSNNNFSGHIQPCILSTAYQHVILDFWKPTSLLLTTKNVSYHYIGDILFFLSGIDLSCNNLKGEIPSEFGNLSHIQLLNLSHNSLTGEIPSTFSNLKEIETLDLSFNNLSGSIPRQLTGLNSLSSFNVAHNNLSGRTPERVAQFGTFEEVSYRDNPYLCGLPLPKKCNEDVSPPSIPENGVASKAKDELIDMDAFKTTFIASYPMTFLTVCVVLYINPQWRRASFQFVEQNISKCYYFVVDNISFVSKFGFS